MPTRLRELLTTATALASPIGARRALLLCSALATLGLVLATFTPVLHVAAADRSALSNQTIDYSGFDRHSVALLLLAGLGAGAALGALRGLRSGPLVLLLSALGVLVIAVGIDLGDLQRSGTLGRSYVQANIVPGAGYYFETAGGVLLLLSSGFGAAARTPEGTDYQR